MALIIKIQINTDSPIYGIYAHRVKGGTNDDDINTYDIIGHTPDERVFFGKVEHRYGDGALSLTKKAIDLAVKEGDKLQCP